MAEIKIDDRKC